MANSVLNITSTYVLENNTLYMNDSVMLTDLERINISYSNKSSDDTSSKYPR